MPKRYLVTAGLPYSNGRLHVGHIAGAYLPADTYVRYLRARGEEVRYICGSDDNGVAIEISAMKAGATPQEISTRFHQLQKAAFAGLRIEFDVYGGTHQPGFQELHERISQEFFRRIHEKGYFTKRRTKQLYDPQANRFLPDRYVRGTCHYASCGAPGATGDQCDQCGQMIDPLLLVNPVSAITGAAAEVRETTHWHLRLNDFEQPLRAWLEQKQGQWRPNVLNFALGQIKQGLPERSMTRDIAWGIPVPLDDPDAKGKVLFVWFDAPIGYISFTAKLCAAQENDWRGYEKWWCDPDTAIVHFIGEDNTVFHTLIWPAMLMADERHQLPSAVVANNFVNIRLGGDAEKVSKSQTAEDSPVWIEEYLNKGFGPDALRYYLTAIAPETARTAFDPQDFVQRNNGELVAALGNFVNRSLTFAQRYCDGKVPDVAAQTDVDRAHLARGEETLAKVGALIEGHRFRAALEELMGYARACNEYFSAREPWRTRKDDSADCAATIATCVQAVHYLAVLSWPFMPGAARKMLQMVGVADAPVQWEVPALESGRPLGEPEILFQKLEADCMD
ncbi:MAG: methionine--tRNA ligase [Planctomycetes bacterium]|nr:methionine--tRNA ligase [Planctomycetota bacterium]